MVWFVHFFHSMCLLANLQSSCAGPDTFALLVGNTKQMWEHFLMACACHQVCLFVQQGSCSIAPSTDICGNSESHLCNDSRAIPEPCGAWSCAAHDCAINILLPLES